MLHRLGLAVQGLANDMRTQRPLTEHVMALRKMQHVDPIISSVCCTP